VGGRMTKPKAVPRQKPMGGGTFLLWFTGAAAAFLLLFLFITLVLRQLPDPIGPRADLFVEGARMTLLLTVVSGLIGLVLGIIIGIQKTSALWWVRAPASLFVWLIRGTPLLVQVLFFYNAVPPQFFQPAQEFLNSILTPLGQKVPDEFLPAVVALALNVAAYNAEVVRGGINAVPTGQCEAARSLGLSSSQSMSTIVLPQALRLVVPPLINNLVALLKDSSLASSIALLEITLVAQRVTSESFQPIPVYATVAAVYLALTTVMTLFTDQLEKRVKVGSR